MCYGKIYLVAYTKFYKSAYYEAHKLSIVLICLINKVGTIKFSEKDFFLNLRHNIFTKFCLGKLDYFL